MIAKKNWTGKGLTIGIASLNSRWIDKPLIESRMNGRASLEYANRAGGNVGWHSRKGQYLCIGRYILRFA